MYVSKYTKHTQTHINHNYHIRITHCSYKILALSYLKLSNQPGPRLGNYCFTFSTSFMPPDGVATTRATRCFISHPSSSAEICSLNSATFSRSLSTKGSSSWWQFLRWRGWYNTPPPPQNKERVNKKQHCSMDQNVLWCFLSCGSGNCVLNVD